MNPSQVPDSITCVECNGKANRMSYTPPDEGFQHGDVIVYACEDCNHRLDMVWEGTEEDDH